MCCNTFSVKITYILWSDANVFFTMCSCSGVQVLTFAPDRGSTISIRSRQVNGCKVCTSSGRSQHCSTYIDVKYNTPVTVTFNCSKPEDVFYVEITRNIGKSR